MTQKPVNFHLSLVWKNYFYFWISGPYSLFVRLIFLKIFLCLIMCKMFFWKFEFWTGIQIDFMITHLNFFSNDDFENFMVENRHFFQFMDQKIFHVLAIIFIPNLFVGCHSRRRNPKYNRKRHKLYLFCNVIKDVSFMSHTLSESPWSEVSGLCQTKCEDHVVAL